MDKNFLNHDWKIYVKCLVDVNDMKGTCWKQCKEIIRDMAGKCQWAC